MSSDSEAPFTLKEPKYDPSIRNKKLTSIIQKAVSVERPGVPAGGFHFGQRTSVGWSSRLKPGGSSRLTPMRTRRPAVSTVAKRCMSVRPTAQPTSLLCSPAEP